MPTHKDTSSSNSNRDSREGEQAKDSPLEQRAAYRLIKVLYYIAFLLGGLLVVGYGLQEKPRTVYDYSVTRIECTNGKFYLVKDLGIVLYRKVSSLFGHEDWKAKVACAYGEMNPKVNVLRDYDLPDSPNYTLNYSITDRVRGDWVDVFMIWMVGLSILYLILWLAKEALIYILYGREHVFKRW